MKSRFEVASQSQTLAHCTQLYLEQLLKPLEES